MTSLLAWINAGVSLGCHPLALPAKKIKDFPIYKIFPFKSPPRGKEEFIKGGALRLLNQNTSEKTDLKMISTIYYFNRKLSMRES